MSEAKLLQRINEEYDSVNQDLSSMTGVLTPETHNQKMISVGKLDALTLLKLYIENNNGLFECKEGQLIELGFAFLEHDYYHGKIYRAVKNFDMKLVADTWYHENGGIDNGDALRGLPPKKSFQDFRDWLIESGYVESFEVSKTFQFEMDNFNPNPIFIDSVENSDA